MGAIHPIPGPRSSMGPTGLSPTARHTHPPEGPHAEAGDFGKMLRSYIDKVDQTQQASAAAVQDLLAGKTQDVLPVVAAMAKADLSFKLLLGVRNKVIEAYKQTMNMQV